MRQPCRYQRTIFMWLLEINTGKRSYNPAQDVDTLASR